MFVIYKHPLIFHTCLFSADWAQNTLTKELLNCFTLNADEAGGTLKSDCCFCFVLFFFLVEGLLYAERLKRPESLHADFGSSILLNSCDELNRFLDRRNGGAPRRSTSGLVLVSGYVPVHQSAPRDELQTRGLTLLVSGGNMCQCAHVNCTWLLSSVCAHGALRTISNRCCLLTFGCLHKWTRRGSVLLKTQRIQLHCSIFHCPFPLYSYCCLFCEL